MTSKLTPVGRNPQSFKILKILKICQIFAFDENLSKEKVSTDTYTFKGLQDLKPCRKAFKYLRTLQPCP